MVVLYAIHVKKGGAWRVGMLVLQPIFCVMLDNSVQISTPGCVTPHDQLQQGVSLQAAMDQNGEAEVLMQMGLSASSILQKDSVIYMTS